MKGDSNVIKRLNKALFLELGTINQYWLRHRLLDDWGVGKLAAKEREENIKEMQNSDKITARILFLGGHPNMQSLAPLRIRENVKDILEGDIAGECEARAAYREARVFADNTHNSHLYDAMGIRNVYLGTYKRIDGSTVSGPSLAELVKSKDVAVAAELGGKLNATVVAMTAIAKCAEGGEAYD